MKNAKQIKWEESNNGTLYIDGVRKGELGATLMADDGSYYANVGDKYRVTWETTDEWNRAEKKYAEELNAATSECGSIEQMPDTGILDDERNACDWENYEVYAN